MRRAAIFRNAAQNFSVFCTRKRLRKIDTNCTNSHEFRSTSTTLEINWCKLVNRADGISEIEGKARERAASE